jgi:hypothetical protein
VRAGIFVGQAEGRDHLEAPSVNWRIILKLISKKWDVGGMDRIDLA